MVVVVVGVVVVGVVVVVVLVVVGVVVDVVLDVVVVLPVPPEAAAVLEFTVVVVNDPSAFVLVALAVARLPAASNTYCPVPLPGPQAVNKTDTLVTATTDTARMDLVLNDTFNIKVLSLRLIGSDHTQISCNCLSESLMLGN